MPTFRTNCGSLDYDASGSGPPVVLLPAAAHDRHDFDAIRPDLDASFRTYAVDWPAHGASAPPRSGWRASPAAFAALVRQVVEQIPEGPVVLIGNSVGANASARVAIDAPQLVSAVVLVDSGGFTRRSPLARTFCWAMGHPSLLTRIYPAFCARYMRSQSALDEQIRDTVSAAMRSDADRVRVVADLWVGFSSASHDLRSDASSIRVPSLVVWGRRDPVIPVSSGRRAARLLDAELVELDTGHVPFASRPGEFLDAVLPFLLAHVDRGEGRPETSDVA